MPPKNTKTPEFKKLQTEWYNKLKAEGFKDLEPIEGRLVDGGLDAFCPGRTTGFSYEERKLYNETKEQYYRLAGHFLHDFKFANDFDKYVWELHSNGLSYRSIVSVLKGLGKKFIYRRKINETVNKLSKQMKVYYSEQT